MVNRIEAAIQKAVIKYVKDNMPNCIITTTANERSYKETSQIGSLGIPDLILFENNRVLFLELKKRTGKLSTSQIKWNKDFDNKFASNIFTRAVAYGYNEAIEIIDSFHNNNC